ncbi:uncharacterized protein LOC129918526 [Episyrphus balteatus]|uniref:uncharacterized protein LOC129918526 n=1 Tax=Episyrphus balteatus TaxID=286459 RepID=UPI00248670F7|nr:uncharacterized protein LOC129918526 [Episyrphus balteatus]
MEEAIDLNEFELQNDEKVNHTGNGEGNGDNIFIKNTKSGQVLVVPFAEVANFYGFEEVSPPHETEAPKETEPIEANPIEDEPKIAPQSLNIDKSKGYNCSVLAFAWNDEQTQFMLEQYEKLINCVGKFKMFKTKKLMWAYIAKLLEKKFHVQLTGKKVETRYKVVLRRKNVDVTPPCKVVYNDSTPIDESICSDTPSESSANRFQIKSGVFIVKPSAAATSTLDCYDEGPSTSRVSTLPQQSEVTIAVQSITSLPAESTSDNDEPLNEQTKSDEETMVEKMIDLRNQHILNYFVMKERRGEERIQRQRQYNDEKLKILKKLVAQTKKIEKNK